MVSTSLLFLASVIGVTYAAPTTLETRICGKVLLPSTQIQLEASAPNTVFPNTALTDKSVSISQDFDAVTGKATNKVNELIAFAGPAVGSYGCTLGITFPSSYTFPPSSGTAPKSINIYSVASPLPNGPTYNNIKQGSLFGTVTVSAGQSTVINSQSCPTAAQGGLAFVFGYPEWVSQKGSLGWIGSKAGEAVRGVYLSYNC